MNQPTIANTRIATQKTAKANDRCIVAPRVEWYLSFWLVFEATDSTAAGLFFEGWLLKIWMPPSSPW